MEPVKLVVTLEGGMITSIDSCGLPIEVAVVDFDTDGEQPVTLPNGEKAVVSSWMDGVEADHLRFGDMLALHDWICRPPK